MYDDMHEPLEGDGDEMALTELAIDDLRERLAVAEAERDAALAERDALSSNETEQQALLERLREALLAADPAIPAELLQGETLEELEASHAAARAMVERVRTQVASEARTADPGGGAPGRLADAPRTARDKIRAGLGGH